jgi:hypothetical protein
MPSTHHAPLARLDAGNERANAVFAALLAPRVHARGSVVMRLKRLLNLS